MTLSSVQVLRNMLKIHVSPVIENLPVSPVAPPKSTTLYLFTIVMVCPNLACGAFSFFCISKFSCAWCGSLIFVRPPFVAPPAEAEPSLPPPPAPFLASSPPAPGSYPGLALPTVICMLAFLPVLYPWLLMVTSAPDAPSALFLEPLFYILVGYRSIFQINLCPIEHYYNI